jgi:hypothetical protein
MFCPTRKAEVKYRFDLADDFSTDLFPSTRSYPPGASVTFQRSRTIYGFIPEDLLLDCVHAPVIKTMNLLNSKLTQIYWCVVDWELWGRSAAKLNTIKLISVGKLVYKEWSTRHKRHRYHKTDPGCPLRQI